MTRAERDRVGLGGAVPTVVESGKRFGGIEAGGTKWLCAVADEAGTIVASALVPTTTPAETISAAMGFFAEHRPAALGIGSFGPLDLRRSSPTFGCITTTPKHGWAGTDVVTPFREALGVPVALDTDVNVAALAEWLRGAGQGLDSISYITVGTGIGGGAVVDGRLLRGRLHPELGHIRVPHDRDRDPFEGVCPFHGDCLEGLASGEAIKRRWGRPAQELDAPDVWELEAHYLALGLLNVTFTLAPERIVIGGGVLQQPGLLPRVHRLLHDLLAGYGAVQLLSEGGIAEYVVQPSLDAPGVVGAIDLGRAAVAGRVTSR